MYVRLLLGEFTPGCGLHTIEIIGSGGIYFFQGAGDKVGRHGFVIYLSGVELRLLGEDAIILLFATNENTEDTARLSSAYERCIGGPPPFPKRVRVGLGWGTDT